MWYCDDLSGVFCEVVLHSNIVAMQKCFKQNEQGFFRLCNESDSPGLQGRDLSNSQKGIYPKSILLYCVLYKIIKKAS